MELKQGFSSEEGKGNVPKEIPESGLGNDFVGRKDAHAVDFGSRIRLGGEMAAHDLEFLEAHLRE